MQDRLTDEETPLNNFQEVVNILDQMWEMDLDDRVIILAYSWLVGNKKTCQLFYCHNTVQCCL